MAWICFDRSAKSSRQNKSKQCCNIAVVTGSIAPELKQLIDICVYYGHGPSDRGCYCLHQFNQERKNETEKMFGTAVNDIDMYDGFNCRFG